MELTNLNSVHQSDVLIVVPFDEIFVNEQGAIMAICKQHSKILSDAKVIYPGQVFKTWELKIFKFPKIQKILRDRYYKKVISLSKNFRKIYVHNDLYLLEYIMQYKSDKKIVFHLHNDIKAKSAPLLKSCDMIFVCSEYLKHRLLAYGVKSIVLPNSLPEIDRIKNQERIYDAIFVGRFDENKGFEDFLEIVIKNKSKKFVVIQAKTPFSLYKYKMYAWFFLSKIMCCIHFHRSLSREQVFRLMEVSKLLVVPTRHKEAFGNVALEGLAADCLVVTSKIGGLESIDIFDTVSIDDLKEDFNGSIRQLEALSESKKSHRQHILSQFSERTLMAKLREYFK